MGRRVLLGLGCLLIAGGIGIAFVAAARRRREGRRAASRSAAAAATPPPVLERVDDLAARVPPGRHVVLRARPEGRGARDGLRADGVRLAADALGRLPERATGSPCGAPSSGTGSSAGCARRRCGSSGARSSSRSTCRSASSSCATHAASSGGSASRSAHPTLRPRSAASTSRTSCAGADFGSYYGCCILALSGRQPNLPEGWSGGDRLAIHGSPTPTWGHAVSNGCLHAAEPDLRYLMKTVPLGTAVRIHA